MTAFQKHFGLSDKDMDRLWDLFMEYGMTKGEAAHRSKGNHYFLQGIGQYNSVEWEDWEDHLTINLKSIIEKDYPQLMVQNKQFEKS